MSTVRMQCLPDLFHRAYNRHPVDRTAGKFRILLERLRRKVSSLRFGQWHLESTCEGDGCVNLGTQVFLVEQGRGLDEGQDACGKSRGTICPLAVRGCVHWPPTNIAC